KIFQEDISKSQSLPHLTNCFRHTILVYLPTAFLLVFLPILFVQARRISRRFERLPVTAIFIARLVLNVFLLLNSTAVLVLNIFFIDDTVTSDIVYPCVWMLFFILHLIIDWNRLRCGQISAGIQHLSIIISAICGAPEFAYHIENSTFQQSIPIFALEMAFWPILLLQTLLYCFADKRTAKSHKSEELDSSFINRLTIWWFTTIQIRGARKDLEMDDLFELNHGSTSEHLSALFEKYWLPPMRAYQQKLHEAEKRGDKEMPSQPSMIFALFRMFKYEFITASLLKMRHNYHILSQLIGFVSTPDAPFWLGISYALLMFIVSELRSMILNAYFNIMMRMGMKIQTALTSAVYRKTLRLSSTARRRKTVGEIINLMAIDVEVLQMVTPQIQQFWSCPYQIIFALTYLIFTLGYSASPGVLIMIIFVPINIFSSVFIKRWQMNAMKMKDQRVKMVNEVLNGIKVIKLYAWEEPMEAHIDEIRQRELALYRKSGLVRSMLDTFNNASPFLVAASSFGTFILSSDEHILTPQIAFVSLTLFNQLRMPMVIIAMLINMMVQAIVSNRRLRNFLVSEELDDSNVKRNEDSQASPYAVEFRDVDCTWDVGGEEETSCVLQSINASIPRGSLVAVVGTVGAGKSSFLSAMLGEVTRLRGEITVTGRLAYVPQQSWIQNLSVRDNITFGRPFDRQWYERVVSACALTPDFAILPDGDATEIGEKGINLSGGQKARISLARAVYQQDDVYLLDDPLSAVDAHVGRHIYNQVLGPRGLLATKTRILVTHSLLNTREADEILVFSGGKIIEKGSFPHLVSHQGIFAKLMEEYAQSHGGAEEAEESDESEAEEVEKKPENNGIGHKSEVAEEKKLIKKEEMKEGGVNISVYIEYIRAASIPLCLMFLVMYGVYMGLTMCRSFWLSAWSNENDPAFNGTRMNQVERLGIYIGIGLMESVMYLTAAAFLIVAALNASKKLHAPLIHNLMRSPVSFFDTTPLGRILNRTSKDIDTIDTQMLMNTRSFVQCVYSIITTLTMIVISTPLFVVVIIPLAVIYFFFLRFYVPTSRQLKRLESVNRSPVYSHFGETIQGAASIRAYGKVSYFCLDSESKLDTLILCKYLNVVSNRWLAVRLEFIGNCIIFFAALFAAFSKEWNWGISAGLVGVSVTYSLQITDVLNFAVRQLSMLEANIVSVERVVEYTHTPSEAEWVLPSSGLPPSWPSEGGVSIENYSTRYRPELDLVLHGISARVRPGEKIGIVGRTGAGKSSFALALFRMIEPAGGSISIDGRSTTTMGLHELRKRLTIIPQEPVLFSGTLRFNLDPFNEYSDDQLWRALQLAHLEVFVVYCEQSKLCAF
ncbi:hypothetical protein PMAYCL1PPCAC_15784, partial [Pristionchus mayeri]